MKIVKLLKRKKKDLYFAIADVGQGKRRPLIVLKEILKPTNSKSKHYDF